MIKVTLKYGVYSEAKFEFPHLERAYEFLVFVFGYMKEPNLKVEISVKEEGEEE